MPEKQKTIEVYLEVGQKRTFAGALDWPGWSRGGRDEQSALQALVEYGPRYAQALKGSGLKLQPPDDPESLRVVQRLKGGSTTDFGAPEAIPERDEQPLDEAGRERCLALLKAYWQAFDAAVQAAEGKELAKGPRGGGRDLDKIVGHVVESEAGYLGALGWKHKLDQAEELAQQHKRLREAVSSALAASVRGEIPERGPRGGTRWPARYFVRRLAWHLLDHLWEIEERIV